MLTYRPVASVVAPFVRASMFQFIDSTFNPMWYTSVLLFYLSTAITLLFYDLIRWDSN